MTQPTTQQLVDNTNSILKSICGTAITGHSNSCPHDHTPQADALVRQIRATTYREIAGDLDEEALELQNLREEADRIEQGRE